MRLKFSLIITVFVELENRSDAFQNSLELIVQNASFSISDPVMSQTGSCDEDLSSCLLEAGVVSKMNLQTSKVSHD